MLQLVTPTWLSEQPIARDFGALYKNGKVRRNILNDLIDMLVSARIGYLVDDANRLFVDVEDPFWVRRTAEAQKRLEKRPLTRGDAKPSKLQQTTNAYRRALARRQQTGEVK
jgi:hypothetical protein